MESFLLAEALVLEKAKKTFSSPMKTSSSTTFALSTYDEFRKAVQKESGPSTPDKPSTGSDKSTSGRDSPGADRPRARSKHSPREGHSSLDKDRFASVDEGTQVAVKRRSMREINLVTSFSAIDIPSIDNKDEKKDEGEHKDRKRPKSPRKNRKSLDGRLESKQ